ncbi:MAG: TOBE domain-containing protein, partial [Thalassolituus sp.]
SSRIALLKDGRIEQVDSPRRMYEFPSTRYAADFIGSVNLFDGHVISHSHDMAVIHCEDADSNIMVHHSQPLTSGMPVTVAVRPEKMRVNTTIEDGQNQLHGVIKEIAYLGDVSIYHVDLPGGKRIQFTQPNMLALAEQPLTWEQEVRLTWHPSGCGVLTQ